MRRTGRCLASSALGLVLGGGPAAADAVLDGSTGSTGSFAGDFEIPAAVGRREGGNLFHSFERFRIRRGESATFTGPRGIDNVISRVTGDEISRINGPLLSFIEGANLFLLNPNGVVFGPEASLGIDGSFHVSTADELRFEDGTALGTGDLSTSGFTVTAPESFGFLGAGAGAITIDRGQLTVDAGETISLVGGPITLDGGTPDELEVLHTDGGRIRLTSTGDVGRVDLETGEADFEIGSRIRVVNGASVNTDRAGGGEVRIVGERLVVRAASIGANNSGAGDSTGGVFVRTGTVLVDGEGVFRGIGANAFGAGDAGRIEIEADTVELRNQGVIASDARPGVAGSGGLIEMRAGRLVLDDGGSLLSRAMDGALGNAGRVNVNVRGSVLITDGGAIATDSSGAGNAGGIAVRAGRLVIARSGSDITAEARLGSTGAAGDVRVVADDVAIRNNAFISTGTRAAGDAGSIRVEAGTLRMSGAMTGIGSQPAETSTGAAGTVMVLAGDVRIRNGAGISTRTFGDSDAGAVTVEADRLLVAGGSGISSDVGTGSSGSAGTVTVSADTIEIRDRASISSEASRDGGDAGTILVEARRLLLDDGSISTRAREGAGSAGEIIVSADLIELQGRGEITSDTSAGDAGPITVVGGRLDIRRASIRSGTEGEGDGGPIIVRVGELLVRDGGSISSDTNGPGNAGILLVDAPMIRLRSGSISSDSTPLGAGGDAGNVLVNADTLFVGAGGRITSATSGGGRAGQVVVVADDAEVRGEVGTTSTGSGDAGTIALAGERFDIQNGRVASEGGGQAAAGDVLLRSATLFLSNASITTEGQQGGLITTDEGPVALINLVGSTITSNGITPEPDASIIALTADRIVLNSSEVTSLTARGDPIEGSGEARLVGELTLISRDSEVAASSRLEIGGLEKDVTAGIEVLPAAFLDVSGQIRESCAARGSGQDSSFGRSTDRVLAPGPDRLLAGRYARGSTIPGGAAMTGIAVLELPPGCLG